MAEENEENNFELYCDAEDDSVSENSDSEKNTLSRSNISDACYVIKTMPTVPCGYQFNEFKNCKFVFIGGLVLLGLTWLIKKKLH